MNTDVRKVLFMKDGRKFEKIDLTDLGAVYLDSPGMSFSYPEHYHNMEKLQEALDHQTLEQRLNLLYSAEENYHSDLKFRLRVLAIDQAIIATIKSDEIPQNVWDELAQSNNGDFVQLLLRDSRIDPKHHTSILERFWDDVKMRGAMLQSMWAGGAGVAGLRHVPMEFFLDKALSTEDFNIHNLQLVLNEQQIKDLAILFEHSFREYEALSLQFASNCASVSAEFLRPIRTLTALFKYDQPKPLFNSETNLYEQMRHNTPFRQLYELYAFIVQLKSSSRKGKIDVMNDAFMEIFNNLTVEAWKTVNEEEQKKYFENDDKWVRTALSFNPNISEELIELLADDEEVNVQRAIAMRDDLASSVLEDLATSRDALTRVLVALNKNTPLSVLTTFFNDDSEEYTEARNEALLNPNFAKYALKQEWLKAEEDYKNTKDRAAYRRMMMLMDSSLWEYNELMNILEIYGDEANMRFSILHNPIIPPASRILFAKNWSDHSGE